MSNGISSCLKRQWPLFVILYYFQFRMEIINLLENLNGLFYKSFKLTNASKLRTKKAEKRSLLRVSKGGSLEPWNFCFGARSPIILTGALVLFWLWSPEPKEIFCGAQSPAFLNLIIRDPRLHWFLFIDCFSVCLCVLTAIKKQNLKRGQYTIQVYAIILS